MWMAASAAKESQLIVRSLLTRRGAVVWTRAMLPIALLSCTAIAPFALHSQAPAPAATAATRALGTVSSIADGSMSVKTDAGATVNVALPGAVRVQQLSPGSTDLKTAATAAVGAIAVGDRVLVSGSPAESGGLTASRVILMKSAAIAERNQTSQADWAKRGVGGIVTAVDPATGTINVSSGTRKLTIDTNASTRFRRYAPGSVKFEDAKPGTLAEVRPGDQLRAKGERSADGQSITAEEIVSGAFRNISGTIASVDPSANTLVVKDLATKKNESVVIGPDSDLRRLPPEMAARFAPGRGARAAGAAQGRPAETAAGNSPRRQESPGGSGPDSGAEGHSAGARTGADLSMMIPRLPKTALSDLKPGEALMIVASGSAGGPYTAITVLSGVEPLLTGPAGSEITLPPWGGSGGGGAEAGGGNTE